MRLTVDLPEDLHRQAKLKAAERGITLSELINAAVESDVEEALAALLLDANDQL